MILGGLLGRETYIQKLSWFLQSTNKRSQGIPKYGKETKEALCQDL